MVPKNPQQPQAGTQQNQPTPEPRTSTGRGKERDKTAEPIAGAPLKPQSLPKNPPRAPAAPVNKGGRPRGAKNGKPRKPREPKAPAPTAPEVSSAAPPGPSPGAPSGARTALPPGFPGGMPLPPGFDPAAYSDTPEDRVEAARQLTAAAVSIVEAWCKYWLPPEMGKAERTALMGLWVPVTIKYWDSIPLVFAACAGTTAIMGPRIGAGIGRAIARRRNPAN